MNRTVTMNRWMKRVCALSLFILAGTTGVQAENGRDFAGFFSVTEVVGGTDEVSLTLSLELFNYSEGDVTNATVRLGGFSMVEPLYESPTTVTVAYRDRTLLTEPVLVVPRQEYEQWLLGALPIVDITYITNSGHPRSATVELVPMVIEGEA